MHLADGPIIYFKEVEACVSMCLAVAAWWTKGT